MWFINKAPVGSRITCSPAPTDTDEDWLYLVRSPMPDSLLGFALEGDQQYPVENFRSFRKDNVNYILTDSEEFFEKFMVATRLATRLNLMVKADRIALFQAVLYGVDYVA